jgi:hypothetical protein
LLYSYGFIVTYLEVAFRHPAFAALIVLKLLEAKKQVQEANLAFHLEVACPEGAYLEVTYLEVDPEASSAQGASAVQQEEPAVVLVVVVE